MKITEKNENNEKKEKVQITLCFSKKFYEQLKEVAKQNDVSCSTLIRLLTLRKMKELETGEKNAAVLL